VLSALREMLQVELQVAQVEAELGKALAALERAVGVRSTSTLRTRQAASPATLFAHRPATVDLQPLPASPSSRLNTLTNHIDMPIPVEPEMRLGGCRNG